MKLEGGSRELELSQEEKSTPVWQRGLQRHTSGRQNRVRRRDVSQIGPIAHDPGRLAISNPATLFFADISPLTSTPENGSVVESEYL